jgi:predicted DNA-binding transcriptional regulator AlpA
MATGKKTGRPLGDTLFPNKEKLKERVVAWLSEGRTLKDFCRQEETPSYATIYRWIDEDKQFARHFAHAREMGHDVIAEEALQIADNMHMGRKVVTHSGGDEGDDAMTVTEEDMLGHRKLQIETRLKLLAKWNPKKYGDATTIRGDDTAPLVAEVSFDIFGEMLKAVALKRHAGE